MSAAFPDPRHYGSLLDLARQALARAAGEPVFAFAGDDGGIGAWSGETVERRARAAAWRLREAGLAPGDRLLLWSPAGPELATLHLAALWAGVVLVPLDLRMAPETIERIVRVADTGWLALGTGRDAPDPREVDLAGLQVRPVEALTAEPVEAVWPPDWEAQVAAWPTPTRATTCLIVFTSGTTGTPRGAVLTHGNLLASIEATDVVIPHRQHRIVSLLPLSHLFGIIELYYGLHGGAPILYLRSRNPRVIFEAIRAFAVTTMVVVPQVLDLFWAALLREVDRLGRGAAFARARRIARHLPYRLRRRLFRDLHRQFGGGLTLFVSAAAFLPPALQAGWEDLGVVVIQGYGATECGFATAAHAGDHAPGTVGRPMPPARVRLDPASGEVEVAGPTVFAGYWRDAATTAAVLGDDGWYHTGDIGRWDARGRLVLSGRLRDMIALPNGLKVYPEDVENALRTAGLRQTVVLETRPGRIEAVVLPPDMPVMPQGGGGGSHAPARSEAEAAAMRTTIDVAVRVANGTLGIHQRVVAWHLWPDADFPRTHTLKVRRDVVRAWLQADAGGSPADSAPGPPTS